MTDHDLLSRYNYAEFVPAKFEPWMRFELNSVFKQGQIQRPKMNKEEK